MNEQLWDFVAEVEQTASQACLEDRLKGVMKASGFGLFTYLELHPNETKHTSYRVSTYPRIWIDRYVEQTYRDVDPSVLYAKRAMGAIIWPPENFLGISEDALAEFYDESAQFGIRSGFTIPMHGPGSTVALLTAATDVAKSDIEYTLKRNRHAWRMLVASTFVTSMRFRRAEVEEVKLSPREAECLLWTSRGKTAGEIGTILSIAERTAVQHLTNACRKFGVYSKHLAVVKAVMMGLIAP